MNDFIINTFKKRYVINLSARKDRYDEFKERTNKYFDSNLIERFDAICGKNINVTNLPNFLKNAKNKGEVGCFLSHQTIWKQTMNDSTLKDDDIILVFEDDIFFTEKGDFEKKFIEAISTFKNINQINKYLYLGGRFTHDFKPTVVKEIKHHWNHINNNIHERIPIIPIINKIFDRTTHVNIFTKSMAKKLYELSNDFKNTPPVALDKFLIWSHTNNNGLYFYDYFPHIFYSPLDYKSDIQNKFL